VFTADCPKLFCFGQRGEIGRTKTNRLAYSFKLHPCNNTFEDAIQESSAKHEAITIIVTRNEEDFKKSDLQVLNPESFLQMVHQTG
jgi:hypothetical protein